MNLKVAAANNCISFPIWRSLCRLFSIS